MNYSHVTLPAQVMNEPGEPQTVDEYVETESTLLSMDDVKKDAILRALERHHGVRKEAAAELGISERTLYRKIKDYGLE
jgi:transcriptional regulator of acetoin/glycerol metabolism